MKKIQAALHAFDKLAQATRSRRLAQVFLRHRVLAGGEHRHILSGELKTVVDVGANRGQFALAVRQWVPQARVISFEPLPGPATVFRRVFSGDDRVQLHQAAIGPRPEQRNMHISAKDDSSSLLPISAAQKEVFPGTGEVSSIEVRVAPLEAFLSAEDLRPPSMLKLDVQGFEYEALLGCESLLANFDRIYCECSFVELYSGQKLADTIIDWLSARGFAINGILNIMYDKTGRTVQADLFFLRRDKS